MAFRMFIVSNPGWGSKIPWVWLWLPGSIFLAVEILILLFMIPSKDTEVSTLIVLGAQINGRKITDSLMRRLDKACDYLKKHPGTSVIVSGGRGKGEDVSEAEAMEGFLVVRGIERSRILQESKSTSTKENLAYSSELLKDRKDPVGIVTNNFHMFRAISIGKRLGFRNLKRIPAQCSAVFIINYMVREFFAIIKMLIVR